MTRAVLVVQSRPSDPSREREYNDWYDNVHLGEVCAIDGIVSARRFQLSDDQMNGANRDESARQYLAIYEISSDDVGATLRAITEARLDGTLHMSDAIEVDPPPITICYELRES